MSRKDRVRRSWGRCVGGLTVLAAVLMASAQAAAPPLKDYLIVSNRQGDVLRFDLDSGDYVSEVMLVIESL